jgi:hypothetical protein
MTQKRPARHRRPSPYTNTPESSATDLAAEALAIREFGAGVIDATDIGVYAVEYALANWSVFPLDGKVPAIPSPHPKGSRERRECKGECGRHGHGVFDATTDTNTVIGWWAGRYAGSNIGVRVPVVMFVLDVDPRHGGLESLAALEAQHGKLPETLTTRSGRGDGGMHLYFRRPPGKLSAARLGPGIDIKTSTGYVVGAPSIHPDTGNPYTRIEHPVATPPAWLVVLLLPAPAPIGSPQKPQYRTRFYGPSTADEYCANTSWHDILTPHRWRCRDADPDADGAR